jgi:hypothetical protein
VWDKEAERERKRAYRARQRELAPPLPGAREDVIEKAAKRGLDLSDPAFVEVSVGARELPIPEPKPEPEELAPQPPAPTRRTLPISEDAYVRLMLAEPAILDYKRAERYARWRYRGVLEGKVAGL